MFSNFMNYFMWLILSPLINLWNFIVCKSRSKQRIKGWIHYFLRRFFEASTLFTNELKIESLPRIKKRIQFFHGLVWSITWNICRLRIQRPNLNRNQCNPCRHLAAAARHPPRRPSFGRTSFRKPAAFRMMTFSSRALLVVSLAWSSSSRPREVSSDLMRLIPLEFIFAWRKFCQNLFIRTLHFSKTYCDTTITSSHAHLPIFLPRARVTANIYFQSEKSMDENDAEIFLNLCKHNLSSFRSNHASGSDRRIPISVVPSSKRIIAILVIQQSTYRVAYR